MKFSRLFFPLIIVFLSACMDPADKFDGFRPTGSEDNSVAVTPPPDNSEQTGEGASEPEIDPLVNERRQRQIRLSAIVLNSAVLQLLSTAKTVLDNISVNAYCNFAASSATTVTVNTVNHDAYIAAQATLTGGGQTLDCKTMIDDAFNTHVERANITGAGYLRGYMLNAGFEGKLDFSGSENYLISGHVPDAVKKSEFYLANGAMTVKQLITEGLQYSDVSGAAVNLKINSAEAFALISKAQAGLIFGSGEIAKTVKSGYIQANASTCGQMTFHFSGSSIIDVTTSCTSPAQFKVNLDTGVIIQ